MKNVPKLRFNGFSVGWKAKKLGDLLEFKNGINADKEAYGKGVKFINVLDILSNNYITTDKIIGRVDIDENTLKKYSVNYGDVLFQRSSETREEVGTANVYLDDETVTFGGFVIRGKKIGDYDPAFMNSLLKSNSVRKEITTKAGGSTRYNVGQEILSEVYLKFPSLEEQKKISNFLTKVDKLIEKQEEKVSNLEQYKKGMMQKIFSQEIRFKNDDGGEYPKWERKHLETLVGRVVRKNKGNVSNRPLTISAQYGLVDQKEFFNKVVASSNLEGYYLLNKGEFAYNKSYSNGYPFGAIKRLKRYDNGAVSTLYICFKPKSGVSSDYLAQYFESPMWHKEVSMIAVEGARNHGLLNISVSDFFETIHEVPCIEEQVKIANFLFKIDFIVEKEREKLEDLRKWKKGLLQGMFL